MRIGLVTLIRDEIDIVEPFIKHIDALFDRVYLIDHQSIDGTGQILLQISKQRPTWNCYSLEAKTKLQMSTSNLMMHEAFADGLDFLFFLDADEFIQVQSREDLERCLANWTDPTTVCCLKWKNCIRQTFAPNKFTFQTNIWIPQAESHFKKVIIPFDLYKKMEKELLIYEGNHGVFSSSGEQIPSTRIGTLLHLPIRSLDQAINKVLKTVIAYKGYAERQQGLNFQYDEMLTKIADGKLSDDDLRGFTLGFEAPNIDNLAVSNEKLEQRGYTLTTLEDLKVADTQDLSFITPRVELGIERKVANALVDLETNIPRNVPLMIKDRKIKISEADLENRKIEDKHLAVKRRDQKIKNLTSKVSKQAQTILSLTKDLNHRDQSIHQLTVDLVEREQEVQTLNAQVQERTQEVLNYALSKSWRIMRPLRTIKKFLKGKRNA